MPVLPMLREYPYQRQGRDPETDAERQIVNVFEQVRKEWPAMLQSDNVPVQLALQLLDNSSVGRAHEYRKFQRTHELVQTSLKKFVHEHHHGFNSSIGAFHKIQGSIQASQTRVRALRDSIVTAKANLCATDPDLKKLSVTLQAYQDLMQTLHDVEELRLVPDQLDAKISEKRFFTAVEILQTALRKMDRPELDSLGALTDLRAYLLNQETAMTDILVEELHQHLYLKSPYCQDRWQNLARRGRDALVGKFSPDPASATFLAVAPFHCILDSIDLDKPAAEDPTKNPEADTFHYIGLLVEALNRLGRLQNAVDSLRQRLPVELFDLVSDTTDEVDKRHLTSLRGGSNQLRAVPLYGDRATQLRADVLNDMLSSLYAKFEAIAETHRVFHETVKALIRREGAGNNSALLGSFKELWNLYQNEIRSLLHNYVTTDADVLHGSAGYPTGLSGTDSSAKPSIVVKDAPNIFKLEDVDARSPDMVTQLDALDGIILATVPGLTTTTTIASTAKSQQQYGLDRRTLVPGSRSAYDLASGHSASRDIWGSGPSAGAVAGSGHKSLVEPSVFNMSLLLPPTLAFLQRLKGIVPPGSDLATSTLTTFLDNFLVNVFQPQLDETLGKLCDAIFAESDFFLPSQDWKLVAKRPVFQGAVAFFEVITAFCRMLGTIPHDQALSSLIVTQMTRYYRRCLDWFTSLVSKVQAADYPTSAAASPDAPPSLRLSALIALEKGEVYEAVKALWQSDRQGLATAPAATAPATGSDKPPPPSREPLAHEIRLLMARAHKSPFQMSDVIQDGDVIASLCLLYTSMNWFAVKVSRLRHITRQPGADSASAAGPRSGVAHRQPTNRWTAVTDAAKPGKRGGVGVTLPMTLETVKTFDQTVVTYEELAETALLTLHVEVRCKIIYFLSIALSPDTAPYLLSQDAREPDSQILRLTSELVSFDETVGRFLRDRELHFTRTGLGMLVKHYLIQNASVSSPMNLRGYRRMRLNISVLQQNLKNIEDGVELDRCADYFALFAAGPDAIVQRAKDDKQPVSAATAEEDEAELQPIVGFDGPFSFAELKTLIELCYSEQLAHPERGVASAAKRLVADKLLALSEHLWEG